MEKVKSYWNERWAKVELEFPAKRCDYYISDYGRKKSVDRATGDERLLKGYVLKRSNYHALNIDLKENGTANFYIHRFVAEHFLDKPEEGKEFVVHKDGNKSNNFYQNLEWLSRGELTARQKEQGVFNPRNRKRRSATKMTESKVRLLKKRLKEGKTKKKILAKSFGITYMQLNRIERGENWGYVKVED